MLLAVLSLWALLGAMVVSNVRPDRGDFRGCYVLEENLLAAQQILDLEACLDWCEENFYQLASHNTSRCICYNDANIQFPACDATCAAHESQPKPFCGPPSDRPHAEHSLYETGLTRPGPVGSLQVTNATNTTITLSWLPTPHPDLVGQYRVDAQLLSSYAINASVDPLPIWTVDPSELHFTVTELRPGAVYNLTVEPVSLGDGGQLGGRRSAQGRTTIGWPQPEPLQPAVLIAEGTTRVVQLPVPQNTMGPVSRVRIAVVFEDEAGLRREFDPNRLVGYAQAQEQGLNYYVTAELEPYQRSRRFTVGDGRYYQGYLNAALPEGQHVHVLLGVVSEADGVQLVRYSRSSHSQHDGLGGRHEEDAVGGGALTDPEQMWKFSDADPNMTLMVHALLIAISIFGTVLVLVVAAYVLMRIRMERSLGIRPANNHEMRRLSVNGNAQQNEAFETDGTTARSGGGGGRTYSANLGAMLSTQLLEHQRVPRNEMLLDVQRVLGNGMFGEVIGGTYRETALKVHVICEDLKPSTNSCFLNELDDVLRMQPHPNQQRFVGICQTEVWLYVIFEGSRTTLKRRLVEERSVYTADRLTATREEFVLRTLYNVACALDFLTKQTYRHKQLCAYNVDITVDDDARLVVFDATTPYDEHGNRVNARRWWAPETLKNRTHTKSTASWAFGNLMWESCTLGATLFPHISNTNDLYARMKAGDRPERCGLFYDDIYQLMLNCWQMDASNRPDFADLAESLRTLLALPKHVLSFDRRDNVSLPPYVPALELEPGAKSAADDSRPSLTV